MQLKHFIGQMEAPYVHQRLCTGECEVELSFR